MLGDKWLAHSQPFDSSHKFSVRLRSGLCAGRTILREPFSLWTLLCPWGHCPAETGTGHSLKCGHKVGSTLLSQNVIVRHTAKTQTKSTQLRMNIYVHIHTSCTSFFGKCSRSLTHFAPK